MDISHLTVFDKRKISLRPNNENELFNLKKLVSILSSNPNRQPLPSMDCDPTARNKKNLTSEAVLLEKFSVMYSKQRDFSSCPLKNHFLRLLESIVKNRFHFLDWIEISKPEHILQVVTCLRMLTRDENCRSCVFKIKGIEDIYKVLKNITTRYFICEFDNYLEKIILELLNIFQKLFSNTSENFCHEYINIAKILIKLTRNCSKPNVINNSIHTLFFLIQIPGADDSIYDISLVENIIRIVQEGHMMAKILAGNIINIISTNEKANDYIQNLQGIPIILSGLKFRYAVLTWNLLWTIIHLLRHSEALIELVYQTGGIAIFVDLLRNDHFYSVNRDESFTPSSALGKVRNDSISDKKIEDEKLSTQILYIKYAVCVAMTEASINIACAKQIVGNNGLFHLGNLILPQSPSSQISRNLQACAFRTLRFIFTFERNHTMFRCLFPPDIYNKFIEIENFSYDLANYEKLVTGMNSLTSDKVDQLISQLSCLDIANKSPKFVRNYKLYSVIGYGAFGVVYSAKRLDGNRWLAVKQVKKSLFRDSRTNMENIVRELAVIEKELHHPNIVRYYKTFMEEESLYIIMEFINGISIDDLVFYTKERGQEIGEPKIWKIVIQIILALRYLHVEKNVIHRDLTSKNIMIGDNDKITITDFGLANVEKVTNDLTVSFVGTRCFCSPEILLNRSYGMKVDIWSMGCVVYHICQLELAFGGDNMLDLVTNIVNGRYGPLSVSKYSQQLQALVSMCLTVSEDDRPDIEQLAATINNRLIEYFEASNRSTQSAQRNLESIIKLANRTPEKITPSDCNRSVSETATSEASLDSGVENCLHVSRIKHSSSSSSRVLPSISTTQSALSISQHSIRARNDPVIQMLEIINKIKQIVLSDYAKSYEIRTLVIDRFNRILFSTQSSAFLQKQHLNLLLRKSCQLIDLNLSPGIMEALNNELKTHGKELLDVMETEVGVISYESLYFIIESIDIK